MYSNEHTLQDLLRKAFHRLEMDDMADEIEVKQAYHRVVGDLISRLTTNVRFDRGTLTVRLASPALRHELSYRRAGLIEAMNNALGRNVVKTINFY